MRGYWLNNNGGSTPSPSSGGSDSSDTDIIGIPPLIGGDHYNNLLTGIPNYCITLEGFPTPQNCPIIPSGVISAEVKYSVIDANLIKTIPAVTPNDSSKWLGYTNKYNIISDDNNYKLNFYTENTTLISTQQCYDVGVKVLEFSFPTTYTLDNLDTVYQLVDTYYLLNKDVILNLPVWTGDFGMRWSEGSSISTMKQNHKYVGVGITSNGERYNLGGNYIQRHYIPQYQCPLDTSWSSPNPLGSFTRNSFIQFPGTYFGTKNCDTIYYQNKYYLPFFISNFSSGRMMRGSSGETEGLTNLDCPKNSINTVEQTPNSLFDNYGYTESNAYAFKRKLVSVLPKISSNQIVHGGDGLGVFDTPLIDNYTYKGRTFNKNQPHRYCYLKTLEQPVSTRPRYINRVYFLITYLKNNIITITPNMTYGHRFYTHTTDNTFS